jgi:hypothetical protein
VPDNHRGTPLNGNHTPTPRKGNRVTHSQDTDVAPANGIPRPSITNIDTEGEHLSPSDLAESKYWEDHFKYHGMGYPREHFEQYPDSFFEEK